MEGQQDTEADEFSLFSLGPWIIAFVLYFLHLDCPKGFRGRFTDSDKKNTSDHWRKRSSNGRI